MEAVREYEAQLNGGPGLEYLSKRGITSAVAASFRLGYVDRPLPGDEALRGRISIPYLTPSGPVNIRFRATDIEAKAKILPYRSGVPTTLYNVSQLFQGGAVWVTEGEIDALSATVAGFPAVGVPGANSWKPVYSRIFRFREVTVLADGDEPGMKFAETVAASIDGCRIIQMPPGEDVNSIFVARGAEGLKELVKR